jgi:hypothetical protein
MITLAAMLSLPQPELSLPLGPPPSPAAYGWAAELAGSCFGWRSRNGLQGRRECFAMVDGFLLQTSYRTQPWRQTSQSCRYEPIGEGLFLLNCFGNGRYTKLARIEGARIIIRMRDDRSALSQPWLEGGDVIERAESGRLSVSHESTIGAVATPPIILSPTQEP